MRATRATVAKPPRQNLGLLFSPLLVIAFLAVLPSARGVLVDRWRAEDLNLLDEGDTVGSWTSLSNRTVSAAIGNRPSFKRVVTPAGGPVVRFNRHALTASSSPLGGLTAFSIALVLRADVVGANDNAQWYGKSGLVDAEQGGVTADWGVVLNERGSPGLGTGNPDVSTYLQIGRSIVDSNFHVVVLTWGSGRHTLYVDNRWTNFQTGVSTAARNNAGFTFGGIHTGDGGTNRRFVGDLAEVRFYNTALSGLEVSNVIADLTDYHITGQLPVIRSFTAHTNSVMIGTPVTLSWQTTNAQGWWIDPGVGVVNGPSGSLQVTPFTTTSYTLIASNEFGRRTALVNVVVDLGLPIAEAQSVATIRNQPVSFTLRASDPNGNDLSYLLVTPPQRGALTGTLPNVTYTPTNDYFGQDFFTFKVNDGTNDSLTATVSIRIEPDPTPPTRILISSTNIPAAVAPGAFLASFRTFDANPLDTHTYVMAAGAGDTHNALFTVSGGALWAGAGYAPPVGTNFSIRLRTTDPTGLSHEEPFVLKVVEVPQDVLINEIHYNSANNSVREEFIELFNPKPMAVDLSWWRLRGGVDFVFPQGTSLSPGGFLVVAQDPPTLLARYGVRALGPWDGQLGNEGERLTLRTPADDVVDAVEFRSEFPWPIVANGGGPSMELVHPSLDNNLGSSWRASLNPPLPSPGATNRVFAYNAAPNLRQVNHTPQVPASTNQVQITCKVTDPEGVGSVQLHYQVVLAGAFLPASLPLTTAQLNRLNTSPALTNAANPAFEAATNWSAVALWDDGTHGDAVAGDSIYTAVLPPVANRTLVRYRITVTDALGASRRAPFEDDPSLNFAYFVYDGIPAYEGISPAVLQTLPVYFLITRAADNDQCTAWFNTADQLPRDAGTGASDNEGRYFFNWEGAMVYDGVVYDHIRYRLRGANGRYHSGKRSFRFRFNDGHYLAAKDQDGRLFPGKWRELTTGKGQSNRGSETFALNEFLNYFLWHKVGVPAPSTFHFHFRVIKGAQETNRYTGDFWGLNWAQERYDVRFLEAHDLPKGNLYKLNDYKVSALDENRYLAPFAVTNGADFDNIEHNLTGFQPTAWLLAHVNYTNWYRYHAVCEAIRHYDFWPSANKNCAWYFEPIYTASNTYLGRMMTLPYDSTDTWGPTWNGGQDVAWNGIFASGYTGGDSGQNPELQKEYRNVVREVRDLLFQPDQVNPLIDAFAARIRDFMPADLLRWSNAPAPARYLSLGIPSCPGVQQGLAGYVRDLKTFMFTGGTYDWWIDGNSVGAGGWVRRLDQVAADAEAPRKPTLRYTGQTGFPLNGLTFESSPFSDPQGTNTFAAMQFRIAEVLDTNAPMADPKALPKLEWDAAWDTGERTNFLARIDVPGAYIRPLKLYRARVRHKDLTGRWSSWSDPLAFYTLPADVLGDLQRSLVFSEIMYNPPNDGPINGDDLEFLELKNLGARTLDLSGLYFSQGVTFTFANGVTLAPGQTLLLARNPAVLQGKHPGLQVHGAYGGRLDNAGETLTITHPHGTDVLSLTYNDRPPWPVTPDGYGFSLVLADAASRTYRASSARGGSPGADDPPSTMAPVLVNELLSHTELPALDAIELHNPTDAPVDVGGWFLSDEATVPRKYRIPPDTIIPARDFVVFDESHFNTPPGAATGFALSSAGDNVYLFSADAGGTLTGYQHGADFGAAESGVTFGRHVSSDGREHFVAQTAPTLGASNAGPRVGPVVFSEIMYHPPDLGAQDNARDEFIEMVNLTTNTTPLFDPLAPANTWQLKGGVDYCFPTNVSLAPGEHALLVSFDPADSTQALAFRAQYHLSADVKLFGPYAGKLNNAGDDVELKKPLLQDATNTAYVLVDKVDYFDQAPWPPGADGAGLSLQRKDPRAYGNDPAHWIAAWPSASAPSASQGVPPVISSQPASQVAAVGHAVAFSVGASGTDPLGYQWRFNGASVAGATQASFHLPNAQAQHMGDYDVVVFNRAGSVLSARAALSIRVPASILQHPTNVAVRIPPDPLAAPSTNATFYVVAYSTWPIRYQWTVNGQPIPSATNASLTVSNVQASDWGEYAVSITDGLGTVVSSPAWLYPLLRLTITQNPVSHSVPVGSPVTLSVEVTGWPPPFTYEWRRGTAGLITNMQAEAKGFFTFTAPNVVTSQQYRVVVRNQALPSGAASPFAILTVLADSDRDGLPDEWETTYGLNTNNALDAAADLDGDTLSALQEYGAGTDPTDSASRLQLTPVFDARGRAWLQFLAPSNRTYTVQFKESLDRGRWTRLADLVAQTNSLRVSVPDPFPATRSRLYRVVTPRQPDTNVGPAILESPQPISVRVGDTARLEVIAAGDGLLEYQWLSGSEPIHGATQAVLEWPDVSAAAAGLHAVRVGDRTGATTTDAAWMRVTPRIVSPPRDQVARVGDTVEFRVAAVGQEPLRYTWYHDARRLRGQANAVLRLENVQALQAGAYRVVVGHLTPLGWQGHGSAPARLEVVP